MPGIRRHAYMENVTDRYSSHIRQEAHGTLMMKEVMSKAIFCKTTRPSQVHIDTHRQADEEGPSARSARVELLWMEFKHIAQIKYITSIELKHTTKDFAALICVCTDIHSMCKADIARLKGVHKLIQFEESYMP